MLDTPSTQTLGKYINADSVFHDSFSFAIHLKKEYAISSPFKLPDDIEEQSLRLDMAQHLRDPYDPSKPTKTTLFMDTEFDQDKVYQKVRHYIYMYISDYHIYY